MTEATTTAPSAADALNHVHQTLEELDRGHSFTASLMRAYGHYPAYADASGAFQRDLRCVVEAARRTLDVRPGDEALLLAAWGTARARANISYPSAGAAQHVRNLMRRILERFAPASTS